MQGQLATSKMFLNEVGIRLVSAPRLARRFNAESKEAGQFPQLESHGSQPRSHRCCTNNRRSLDQAVPAAISPAQVEPPCT